MATTAALPRPPETRPEIPERDGYEYVDGKWLKLAVGAGSTCIAMNLAMPLHAFVQSAGLGWVPGPHESLFQIWPQHPRRYRKPDVSFIRRESLPYDESFIHEIPALVVEVVSPRDIAEELEGKIAQYLDAGVELVWVIHPRARVVVVHRAHGPVTRLRSGDILTGEDVVPGFRMAVDEILSLRIP